MSDLMPLPVLLAILQNQIKNAVDENKVDTSKFAIVKTIGDASALTAEEKNDIGKNAYQFLIDSSGSVFVLVENLGSDDWTYSNLFYDKNFVLSNYGLERVEFRNDYYVNSNINGDVTFTNVIIDATDDDYASADDVSLQSDKYPDVFFHGNYFSNTTDSIIYRFSSGIILDSSETQQYKIVFASYDVNAAKVTFVEKVLP